MAKIVESYVALKFSKLVKDSSEDTFEISEEISNGLVEIIEEFLKESGNKDIIVEIVSES